ncbi:MAG: hypothetical protein JSS07_06080 [Proteobacteria bacterium]|nr:hypothetical protein [Pseudomonadota bacterium]
MTMHTPILENIHALLDFNHVPKSKLERVQYFSQTFGLSIQESENVLAGEQVPNKKLLKQIADKFEVDPLWLLKN